MSVRLGTSMKENEPKFPMRINRYLALRGFATRRAADDLVKAGRVLLNGKPARLGDQVTATDRVELLNGGEGTERKYEYIVYYKPRGVITHSPQKGERSIADTRGDSTLFPMGRLDKESEGLIILTNDGRVTERLLHPRFAHEKEYIVTVREKTNLPVKRILEAGVMSEGEKLTAKKVRFVDPQTLSIILTEGKKHEIRRMLASVNLTVEKLVRVRVMSVSLGGLTPGASRRLIGRARIAFLTDLGLR